MTPEQRAFLTAQATAFGVGLDDAALQRLARFFGLLSTWNPRIRLTGERQQDLVVRKHGGDSLAPVRHLPQNGLIVDIGSGGGFPGIVLGCVRPDLDLVLLDSRRRAASFLREAVRTIPLPRAAALHASAVDATRDAALAGRASVVIARGLRVDVFLDLAKPLLATDAVAIAMQTPQAASAAGRAAERTGLGLVGRYDYEIAKRAPRTLFLFKSARAVS